MIGFMHIRVYYGVSIFSVCWLIFSPFYSGVTCSALLHPGEIKRCIKQLDFPDCSY